MSEQNEHEEYHQQFDSEGARYLTDRTRLAAPIASWFQIAAIIATIVGCYFALRADVSAAVIQGEQNAKDISIMSDSMRAVQMDLKVFHQKYEDDMDRYVREYPDRHR